MLVSINAKIYVTPNASQWNPRISHVDFMLFIPFFSHWVPNANAVLSGIWALKTHIFFLNL